MLILSEANPFVIKYHDLGEQLVYADCVREEGDYLLFEDGHDIFSVHKADVAFVYQSVWSFNYGFSPRSTRETEEAQDTAEER